MAAISQPIDSGVFLWKKICVFWLKFDGSLVIRVQLTKKPSTGLDNGLAPNRRQAIISTNADRLIYAYMGHLGEMSYYIRV